MLKMLVIAVVLYAFTVEVGAQNILRVCAVGWSYGWNIDGNATKLTELVTQAGGNYTLPCSRIGVDPFVTWDEEDHSIFPVTGFAAEMLLEIVSNMGDEWDCVVSFLPTFNQALYATTKQHVCDVAYSPYGVTAARANCNPNVNDATGLAACPPTDEWTTWENSTREQSCCANFVRPLAVATLGGIVLRETNNLATDTDTILVVVLDLLNVMIYVLLWVVAVAHVIWFVEKANPATNVFSQQYLMGILDATWAVSTGFAGVQTPCARLLGILYGFINMAILGILAGVITTVLTTLNQGHYTKLWETLEDLPSTTRVCSNAAAFNDQFEVFRRTDTFTPEVPGTSAVDTENCWNALVNGDADIFVTADVALFAAFLEHPDWYEQAEIILGRESFFTAGLFTAEYTHPAQALFETAAIESELTRLDLYDRYFSISELEDAESASAAAADKVDIVETIDWVAVSIFATYFLFMIVAHNIQNIVEGRQCFLARLVGVCRNIVRETKLNTTVSLRYSKGVDKLSAHVREAYSQLDTDGTGFIEEAELDALAERLAERCKPGQVTVSAEAGLQIKNFMMHIFDQNVDAAGTVSPETFEDAFLQTVTTVEAQELFWDLARQCELERDEHVSHVVRHRHAVSLSGTDSRHPPIQRGIAADVTAPVADVTLQTVHVEAQVDVPKHGGGAEVHPVRRRRRNSMMPPLNNDQAARLALMLRRAVSRVAEDAPDAGNGAIRRLSSEEIGDVIQNFGQACKFSSVAIQKMTTLFIRMFNESETDATAVHKCVALYKKRGFSVSNSRTGLRRESPASKLGYADVRKVLEQLLSDMNEGNDVAEAAVAPLQSATTAVVVPQASDSGVCADRAPEATGSPPHRRRRMSTVL